MKSANFVLYILYKVKMLTDKATILKVKIEDGREAL